MNEPRDPNRPTLSFEWLNACCGCEIALLNSGEQLLALLKKVDIVHFPLLMDHKYAKAQETEAPLALPQADIGIISGGVAHREHLVLLREMRKQCKILIALGTCATHGGIPAMRNQWTTAETLQTVATTSTVAPQSAPCSHPEMLDRVYALDEKTTVDILAPGCPPHPDFIVAIIEGALAKERPSLPRKSACDTCPTLREGKLPQGVRRFLDNAKGNDRGSVEQMRCLLEQGLLCMGPVTAGGCGGGGTPLCIKAKAPCRGCYGPVRHNGNQLLDMMNALASKGLDYRTIVDRKSLLRFSGGHGLLRPVKKVG